MLKIIKAKPNPFGKDRTSCHYTPATKLAGEWIDIKNNGSSPVALNGLSLWHLAYLINNTTEWQLALTFDLANNFSLLAGQVIRVHSGHRIDPNLLPMEDQDGANWHVFTDKDYIWNNKLPDKPTLTDPRLTTNNIVDQTSYSATFLRPIPDGKILERVNYILI